MSPPATAPDQPTCLAVIHRALEPKKEPCVVYTIDVRSIPSTPFGRETFSRREDAEWFVEEVRRHDPDLANDLRIEERELGERSMRRAA